MPRVVKKVKKQKGSRKLGKKFWILLSLGIVAAIAIAVTITLIVYFKNKDDEYDYFKSISDDTSITYDQAKKKLKEGTSENVFIFYWDKTLDPEDNKTDAETEKAIINLYNKILDYNKIDASSLLDAEYESFAFYLVYTGDSKGSGALGTETTDDDGNTTSTANETSGITKTNALAYYYGGVYSKYPKGATELPKDYKYDLTVIKEAINFVSQVQTELNDKLNK